MTGEPPKQRKAKSRFRWVPIWRSGKRWFDIRTSFLTGVVVAAPIGITIYLTFAFVTFVDRQVTALQKLLPDKYEPFSYLPFTVPGIGLVVMFIALTLLGAFTANVFGRWILDKSHRLLNRMPVVRNIYGMLKQIFETVVTSSDQSFKQVALVEYPRRGIWALAFVTSSTKGEIATRLEEDAVSLFLPTTPNPTSGFLLFAPRSEVVILDMTVEEGAKMVISGGLVVPEHKTAADRALEAAGKKQRGKDKASKPAAKPTVADETPPKAAAS